MFESGDIVEYVDGTDSQLLVEEKAGHVHKGELFFVIPGRYKGHIDILLKIGVRYKVSRYSKCFRLVVKKNRYGHILII
jgi:hypothetical protein